MKKKQKQKQKLQGNSHPPVPLAHPLINWPPPTYRILLPYVITTRKRQGNVQIFICYLVCSELLLFSNASFLASFWITILLPQQLSMELTTFLLLKNTINLLLFFLECKLYIFPQSVLLRFAFVYEVNVVLNIFCLDTSY